MIRLLLYNAQSLVSVQRNQNNKIILSNGYFLHEKKNLLKYLLEFVSYLNVINFVLGFPFCDIHFQTCQQTFVLDHLCHFYSLRHIFWFILWYGFSLFLHWTQPRRNLLEWGVYESYCTVSSNNIISPRKLFLFSSILGIILADAQYMLFS